MKQTNRLHMLLILTAAFVFSLAGIMSAKSADKALAADTGTIYYVDSVTGNDNHDGLSESTPWKTLSKINQFGGTGGFEPGDRILLKAGSVWNEQLTINFSGDESASITLGRYGSTTERPVINAGGGLESAAVTITNQEYLTVQDLELTNFNAADPDDYLTGYYRRSGIWVQAYHNGVKRGIEIKNLDIHHVRGISLSGEDWTQLSNGQWVNKNHNAAIMLNGWSWADPDNDPAYYEDILIENNYIHDVSVIGINMDGNAPHGVTERYHKNVTIRNNSILSTGADAVMLGRIVNPVVEYNISYDAGEGSARKDYKWIAGMWTWGCHGSTFQYNEVARVNYVVKGESDSAAFDTDIYSTGDHIYQYNYSHENEGGFMMNMGQLRDGINIIRYNISQNDKHNGFTGTTMNLQDPAIIYNNTFYQGIGDGIIIKDSPQVTFINNIFYVEGGASVFPKQIKYYNNAFYGVTAPSSGVNNIMGDPGLVNPGSGRDGMNTADGYKLKADSPLIGAGVAIENNGGRDFFGNPLYTGAPDLGAFESPGSTAVDTTAPAAPTNITVTEKSDTYIALSWNAVENGIPLSAEVYAAANDTVLASVMMENECVLEGLTPGTEYSFYIRTKDRAGNLSVPSEVFRVTTTIAAIIADDAQAAKTGTWAVDPAVTAYEGSSSSIAKGTGANSITWTPNLLQAGYYKVFYWLPTGSNSNSDNAKYTISFDGGSKTYTVNQKAAGGQWILLGIHRFAAGASGSVQVTDDANGLVVADAVKFLLVDDYGLDSIKAITVVPGKTQLRLEEQATVTAFGLDAIGNAIDLAAEDVTVTYSVSDPGILAVNNGLITGLSNGAATVSAQVIIGDRSYTSVSSKIYVGPQFVVEAPVTVNGQDKVITKYTAFDIVNASVTAFNNSEDRRKIAFIAALYDQNGMIGVSTQEIMIDSYSNAKAEVEIGIPQVITGTTLKIFVWDGLSTMVPLTGVKTLQPDTSTVPTPTPGGSIPTPTPGGIPTPTPGGIPTPTPGGSVPTPAPGTQPAVTPALTPEPEAPKTVVRAEELEKAIADRQDYTVEVKNEEGKVVYSWTFTKQNLKRAAAKDLADIKLGLTVAKLDANADINNLLTRKNKNQTGLVISFEHEGKLPVQASVRIYVGGLGIEKNTTVYLYYYNPKTGKLDILPYTSKGFKVDKDGYVTINIVHCSDYVLLPNKADASTYTGSLAQIVLSPAKVTLYTGGTKYGRSEIKVTMPSTFELVKSLKEETSGTAVGAVTVTYKSSNTKVATVSGSGAITAKGKGSAKITATVKLYSGLTKTFTTTVTVKEPSITISGKTAAMKLGSTFTFEATAAGYNKNDIVWMTSKRDIVIINKKTGRATAKTKGTDYVEARIDGKTVKVKVVVK